MKIEHKVDSPATARLGTQVIDFLVNANHAGHGITAFIVKSKGERGEAHNRRSPLIVSD